MRRIGWVTLGTLAILLGCGGAPQVASERPLAWLDGFARCNLKVLKGNAITWVNWQSTPESIPVGTPLQAWQEGSSASLRDPKAGIVYTLDLGSSKAGMLEKFFTRTAPDLSGHSSAVKENIAAEVARVGMSKPAVYIAMGPPATILGPTGQQIRTNESTYDDILAANTWIYARRRFGKNIGVAFSSQTGLVERTEGIWR